MLCNQFGDLLAIDVRLLDVWLFLELNQTLFRESFCELLHERFDLSYAFQLALSAFQL